MMNWIAGQWTDGFKCLVQHDGVFDARAMAYETEELWFDEWEHGGPYFKVPEEYEKWNPVNHVDKWKTPMLVITSEKDFRIPYTQGLAAFTALQRRGVPSQLLVFPDENHWVLKGANSVQWHPLSPRPPRCAALHDRQPAAERYRRAAYRPCARQHAAGRSRPL